MALRLDPLVNGIHNEQMEKKLSRNDISILSTVGQHRCQPSRNRAGNPAF